MSTLRDGTQPRPGLIVAVHFFDDRLNPRLCMLLEESRETVPGNTPSWHLIRDDGQLFLLDQRLLGSL